MINNVDMKDIIEQSFIQYAGAVLQSRALVDVRDCIKPSARQIEYCLFTDKFLPNKPFKKTMKALGSVVRLYIHGDTSAVGIMMRYGQAFAMRYPLTQIEGNAGNLQKSGNWSAPRYTATRLSDISTLLFQGIKKETIDEWLDNYDNTEKYPIVLPSKGYYNIVNGTSGIGVGASSSIPQFNLRDVNKAMETLLLNPNASFEEIYCPVDFATGGYLINEDEVKESLKNGTGKACKIRAKIDYEPKENTLVVSEMPYGVYTETICGQLEALLEDEDNPGIDRFNDLTGVNANIKIYLKKGANVNKVIKTLYKVTSLQSHYGINMTMLRDGRFPETFTWKEALQAHIDHEKDVYRKEFEFDLRKIAEKVHIYDGFLICLASIDEVVATIKGSSSTADAKSKLMAKFLLDEVQAAAVLDMKLARLARLEVEKIKQEREELLKEKQRIETILNDTDLFNQQLINGWRETSKKFGDDYRTKIIKIVEDDEEDESNLPNAEDCIVILSKNGDIKRIKADSFKVQKRNGKGVKTIDDAIFDPISTNTIDTLMVFTDKGKMYKLLVDNVPEGTNISKGIQINTLIDMEGTEKVAAITSLHRRTKAKYVVFITKQGMIKKSSLSEYTKIKRSSGIAAIKLNENDSIANVTFLEDEELVLITKNGMGIHFETSNINPIGRVAVGVKGIKMAEDDEVLVGLPIHNLKDEVAIFTSRGYGKKITLEDIPFQGRGGKGVIIHKESDSSGNIIGAAMVSDTDSVLLVGTPNSICISAADIPSLGRTSLGNIMIKNSMVKSVVKI